MKTIALILLAILFAFPTARIDAGSPGKWYFERAYRLESRDPKKAIQYYILAIRSGLDTKLRIAARWRLFYLYKQTNNFINALRTYSSLGSPSQMNYILQNLHRDMKIAWKINDAALSNYLAGVCILYGLGGCRRSRDPDERAAAYTNYFRKALHHAPNNRPFSLEIAHRLMEKGRGDLAAVLLAETKISVTEQFLLRADQLVREGQTREAEKILRHMSEREHGLKKFEKAKILYLLGRIARDRGNHHRAVIYFRLSARYSEDEHNHRRIALAAYTVYKRGLPMQAMALMRGMPLSKDATERLLTLVLRAEVDGDEEAVQSLARMKQLLLRWKRAGRSPFLTQKALRIIARRK